MKKKFLTKSLLLLSLTFAIGTGNFANAQETNLLSGWDGGSSTSAPSSFGWSSSKGKSFNELNASSGMRITTTYSGYKLEDGTSYSYSADSDLSSKVFWIRYNDSGESFTYTFTGLEAGETYYFTGLVGWHNNSNAPTVKTTISAGDDKLAEISKSISQKMTMYKISQAFKVPANCSSESFKMSFSANQTSDCMVALSAFSLTKLTGSETSPVDITSSLKNPSFEGSGSTSAGAINAPQDWTMNCTVSGWLDGTINTVAPSAGSKCYNLWAATVTSTDMNQTITLPAGKYLLSADFRIDNLIYVTNQGVYATVDGQTYKSTETIKTVANPWNSKDGWNTISTYFYVLDDEASVKIGASSTGANGSEGWYQIDNFQLKYCGKQQLMFADDLVGTAKSDKWYKLKVALDGDYNITSSENATIYYSQNGEQTDADVTENVVLAAETPETLSLTAGTLYVKSDVATTITLSASSYSYTLGEATVNPANNAYIQNGHITVTFPNAVTNDPDAVLSLVSGAKATVNEAETELSATTGGFSFDVSVSANTTYNVTIPAGVFGYDDQAMNSALEFTFRAPAILDGVYYIYNSLTKKFISRGNAYNTSVTVDDYGTPMQLTTNAENKTSIISFDSQLSWGFDEWMYSDAGGSNARTYNIESTDGGNTILNTNNSKNVYVYLFDGDNKFRVAGNAIKDDNYTDDAQIVWQFKTPTEHATIVGSYKDVQAAAAAEAAAIDGVTTKAGLETAVEDYGTANVTITTPSSVQESYQFGGGESVYTKSVSDLKPGLYKLTVEAFSRLNGFDATYTAMQGGYAGTTSYIYANDAKTQICSVVDECATSSGNGNWWNKDSKYYPNDVTSAGAAFDNGSYKNEVWVYVSADDGKETGTLSYGIKEPGKCENAHWLCYRKFTLTYYSNNKADADDYAALATAITAAEANTLGFEAGEYAPYNNVDALKALAEAKAINTTVLNEKDAVEAATTALKNATWTTNTEEVNAVYDGTFASATNDGAPAGWTMSDNTLGGSYHSRAFVGDDRLSEFNSTNSGVYLRFDGTNSSRGSLYRYGQAVGYTMPLKANTTYYVSVDAKNWGSTNKPLRLYVSGPNSFNEGVTKTISDDADKTETAPVNYFIVFTTSDAGDYVINFQCPGDDSNKHSVMVSNVELKKATSANMKIYADVKWGTFVAPFAVAIPEDVEAYKCTEVVDGVITTEFVEETTIPANTPVLVYSKTDVDETFYGKAVAIEGDPTCGVLVGTYEAKAAPVGSYVLQKNNDIFSFYKVVSGAQPTVGANRCYLSTSSSSTVLRFGGATNIQSMEQQDESVIYDLTGRRVDAAVKGIYIVNGKKMLVK